MSCPTDIASKSYVDQQMKKAISESQKYTDDEIKKLKQWIDNEFKKYVKLSDTNWWAENMHNFALPVGGSAAMLAVVGGVPLLEKQLKTTTKTAEKALDFAEPALQLAEEIDNTKLPRVQSSVNNLQEAIENTKNLARQAYDKGLEAYHKAIASGKSADEAKIIAQKAEQEALDAFGIAKQSNATANKAISKSENALQTGTKALSKSEEALQTGTKAITKSEDALKIGLKAADKADEAIDGVRKTNKLVEILKFDIGKFASELPGIKGSINFLKAVTESLDNGLKAMGTSLARLGQIVGVLSGAIDILWALINQGQINEIDKRVERLENYVFDRITNDIVNILGKIRNLQNKFQELNAFVRAKIAEFGARFPPIENALQVLANDVGGLKSEVINLDNRIDYQAVINEKQNVDITKATNEAGLAMNFASMALTGLTALAWVNGLRGLPSQVAKNTSDISELAPLKNLPDQVARNTRNISELAPLKPLHNPNHPHMNPSQGGTMVTERIIEKQPIIYNNYITKPTQVINKEKVVTVPTPAWQPIPNLQPREVKSYIPVVTERVVTVPQQVPVVTEKVVRVPTTQVVTNTVVDSSLTPMIQQIDFKTNLINQNVQIGNGINRYNQGLLMTLRYQSSQLVFMVQTFVTTTWTKFINSRLVDKAINAMNLALNIHNAAMLSRDLGDTFLYMLSNVLSAIGIKDDDGNPYDIASLIGNTVENIIVSVVGQEVWNNTSKQFNSLNRIYQSGMNVIYTVSNIVDSSRNILETVGEYVGKIGNALRRSGEVAENAYQPMQEKFDNISNNRFEKFFDKVENFEEKVSAVDMVASDVISIQDSVNEFQANKAQFKADIRQYQTTQTNINQSEPMDYPQSLKDLEDEAKLNSEAPINLEDARF